MLSSFPFSNVNTLIFSWIRDNDVLKSFPKYLSRIRCDLSIMFIFAQKSWHEH